MYKAFFRTLCLLATACMLGACAAGSGTYQKGVSIAVWDVENMTPGNSGMPDMGELLSGKVIEALKTTGNFSVVERQQLKLALEELNLGSTGVVDEATRLKLGKIVGARLMVLGGYQVISRMMRMDLRLIDVETGKMLKASQQTVSATGMSKWIKAAEAAAKEFDNTLFAN